MVLSGLVCAGANVEGTPNRGDDTAEEGSEGKASPAQAWAAFVHSGTGD